MCGFRFPGILLSLEFSATLLQSADTTTFPSTCSVFHCLGFMEQSTQNLNILCRFHRVMNGITTRVRNMSQDIGYVAVYTITRSTCTMFVSTTPMKYNRFFSHCIICIPSIINNTSCSLDYRPRESRESVTKWLQLHQ